jgi:Lar family restriction alleviation protein
VSTTIKLLPCPFCGGTPKIHVGLNNFFDVEIVCDTCSASGSCFDDERDAAKNKNKEAAAKHWNTRVKA